MKLQSEHPDNIRMCLPESFEWLILRSGLIDNSYADISAILEDTSEYVEIREIFSWENFFEHLLIKSTEHTHFQYAKSSLNSIYLIEENSNKIAEEIKQALKK